MPILEGDILCSIMLRPISTILSLLTWCFLAVPWLVCNSDCREGSVQLLIHDCHPVAHQSCYSAEDAGHCHAGVEHDGDVCVEHEDETHRSLVFQQASPEPIEFACPKRWVTQVLDYPWMWELVSDSERGDRIESLVDPPGFETQALVQLRTDVLLR